MSADVIHLGEPLIESNLSEIAQLLYSTAETYFSHIFLSKSKALEQLKLWCCRSSSEYYYGRTDMLFENGTCAGLITHLTGAEVPMCRKSDALALLAYYRTNPSEAFRPNTSRGIPHPVPANSQYVRAVAVPEGFRGRGYAFLLLKRCEEYASQAGMQELRLDVRADNLGAIAVYERFGFSRINTWCAVTEEAMLTMTKKLTS
jgi:ribosomal protein S18 acetylase RimI-like enzyme